MRVFGTPQSVLRGCPRTWDSTGLRSHSQRGGRETSWGTGLGMRPSSPSPLARELEREVDERAIAALRDRELHRLRPFVPVAERLQLRRQVVDAVLRTRARVEERQVSREQLRDAGSRQAQRELESFVDLDVPIRDVVKPSSPADLKARN